MAIAFPFKGIFSEDKEQGKTVQFEYGLSLKRILVTGANGQLGNEMRLLADRFPAFQFDFTDIGELDLCNADAVLKYCQRTMPAYIVNCAAYTAVEKAEDDADRCFRINRDTVENLANAAKAVNAKILHESESN